MWENVKIIYSTNENVSKYIFTKDDAIAESVLYKYPTYKERTVICCSTQSGCPVGCRFCFEAGTLVDVNENGTLIKKKIENIIVGDKLIGIDSLQIVNEIMQRDYSGEMIEIELENGEKFVVTWNHEMIGQDGSVIIADDLLVGDNLK
jgi:hypothetical protein